MALTVPDEGGRLVCDQAARAGLGDEGLLGMRIGLAGVGRIGIEHARALTAHPEVDALVGDATKAEVKLGWKATVDTAELARIMVDADIKALEHAGSRWIDEVRLESWGTHLSSVGSR